MDLTQEVDLTAPAQRVVVRWRWIVLSVLAGAALGLGVSLLRPPVYLAQAAIAVSLDPAVNGPLELVVEDRALDRVHQLILADETLAETVEVLQGEAPANTAWGSVAELRSRLRLEQRLARWELGGIDRDPAIAARIANAWAGVAVARLDEARDHAWRVLELRGSPFLVECYKHRAEDAAEATVWECVSSAPGLDPADSLELQAEVQASRGILPSLSFEWVETAHPPSAPAIWDRGLLVLAGAALGLLAGVLLSAFVGVRPPAAAANRKTGDG